MARVLTHRSDLTGKDIDPKSYVVISLSDSEGKVHKIDANRDEIPAKWWSSVSSVESKRGRKKGSTNSKKDSGVGSTTQGAVAGKINR